MKQFNKKFLCIILILSIAKNSQQLTGLQKAVRLIQRRTTNFQHSNDILLKYKLIPHEQKCYNIQRLKQIIGIAWEHVFTDFGFNRTSTCPRGGCDYDLKNRNIKTVIELKNNYQSDSGKAKKYTFNKLKEFKRRNPLYTVIYASINYKNTLGKEKVKDGILHLYGNKFLNRFLGTRKNYIITTLRNSISL